MGLINKMIPDRPQTQFVQEIRSIWLRLILNPNEELCELINSHILQLKQRYMIGVQLRFGGIIANFKEEEGLMSEDGLKRAIAAVKLHVKQMNLKWEDVYIFISTDSNKIAAKFRWHFEKISKGVMYTIDDFDIGHSAPGKTGRYKEGWVRFTKRAIVDMMILKESDFYIYTKRSSFGKFARELQKSYNISVDVDEYMRKRGMKCSVYHKRNTIGLDEPVYFCVCSIIS